MSTPTQLEAGQVWRARKDSAFGMLSIKAGDLVRIEPSSHICEVISGEAKGMRYGFPFAENAGRWFEYVGSGLTIGEEVFGF